MRRKSSGEMEAPDGKAHWVRLLRVSVRNRPCRLTLVLPRLTISIQGSNSPALSAGPWVLKTSSSFSQRAGGGRSVVETEFLAPGVGAAPAQLATRRRSRVGSMSWRDAPAPSALV